MPQATVAAIITSSSHRDSILLTQRKIPPFGGQWCLPGGHIDPFEPAREAVLREVKEETGLDFDPRFLGYFDEIIPERGIHAVVIVFAGTAMGSLNKQEDEVADIRWFSIQEARSLPLAFDHGTILDAYAARRLDAG